MWICDENATWSLFHCDSSRLLAFGAARVDEWEGESAACHREQWACCDVTLTLVGAMFLFALTPLGPTGIRIASMSMCYLLVGPSSFEWAWARVQSTQCTQCAWRHEEKWKIINTRHCLGDEHYTVEATHGVSSLLLTHCWLRYIMHKRIQSEWACRQPSCCDMHTNLPIQSTDTQTHCRRVPRQYSIGASIDAFAWLFTITEFRSIGFGGWSGDKID